MDHICINVYVLYEAWLCISLLLNLHPLSVRDWQLLYSMWALRVMYIMFFAGIVVVAWMRFDILFFVFLFFIQRRTILNSFGDFWYFCGSSFVCYLDSILSGWMLYSFVKVSTTNSFSGIRIVEASLSSLWHLSKNQTSPLGSGLLDFCPSSTGDWVVQLELA